MKIINKDLTQEKIWVNVSGSQFYAEVFTKVHGKWTTQTYFENFNFEVDKELCKLTIQKIYRLWNLNNPKLFLCFGN